MVFLVVGCVAGLLGGTPAFAQGETPTETPTQPPTATETPTEVPTATFTIPVSTPTPTETAVEPPRLEVNTEGIDAQVGAEIVVPIQISNAQNVDAFGFDIQQSNSILEFVAVQSAGTLTENFLLVNGDALADPPGTVRIGAVGGAQSINVTDPDDLLLVQYRAVAEGTTELTITNIVDDIEGADVVAGTITVTAGQATPTETPTEAPVTPTETATEVPTTPTEVPVTPTEIPVTPTETATEIPSTPTETATEVPVTPTETPIPGSPTPVPTGDRTPLPVFTPTPSATALILNPRLGLVTLDEMGGTYPKGNAVHNFDLGITNPTGLDTRAYDGLPDPVAFAPYLVIGFMGDDPQGSFVPIAMDSEFTGEVNPDGNGSEGVYFLIGGNVGPYQPVHPRLGATGGPTNGGIDVDNIPENNFNFGTYSGDIVPVYFEESTVPGQPGQFITSLLDIEPAGNDGFYVLSVEGRIYAQGAANEALDTTIALRNGAQAKSFKIWRSGPLTVDNSVYSADLIGAGAYVLDTSGGLYTVGEVRAIDTTDLPAVEGAAGMYQDIELMPNQDGTDWIGLAVLKGDGMVEYVPFSDVTVTQEIQDHVNNIMPFGNMQRGFPFNIGRDLEIQLTDETFYGVGPNGETVAVEGRKVGSFMFDSLGGIFTGGGATRFAPAWGFGDRTIPVDGVDVPVFPFPVNPPYFGAEVVVDNEISPLLRGR